MFDTLKNITYDFCELDLLEIFSNFNQNYQNFKQ